MTGESQLNLENVPAVLKPQGDITLGAASADFRDAFKSVLAQKPSAILLDLAEVDYIDSGGLGELIRCYGTATATQVPLKFCRLQPKVRDLFRITRLDAVFETFGSLEEGLAAFDGLSRRPTPTQH